MDANTTAACIAFPIIIGVIYIGLMAIDRALQRYNRLENYKDK